MSKIMFINVHTCSFSVIRPRTICCFLCLCSALIFIMRMYNFKKNNRVINYTLIGPFYSICNPASLKRLNLFVGKFLYSLSLHLKMLTCVFWKCDRRISVHSIIKSWQVPFLNYLDLPSKEG